MEEFNTAHDSEETFQMNQLKMTLSSLEDRIENPNCVESEFLYTIRYLDTYENEYFITLSSDQISTAKFGEIKQLNKAQILKKKRTKKCRDDVSKEEIKIQKDSNDIIRILEVNEGENGSSTNSEDNSVEFPIVF